LIEKKLVDENLDTFRLQWDDFVRGELSDSSWKAHIIGQARVQTESKIRLVAATKTTNEQDDNDDFRRSRAQLNHTDFSLNLIIYKVILINRIEIDSPSQSEFVEQLDVCFVKGHDHQTKTVCRHYELFLPSSISEITLFKNVRSITHR